MGLCHVRLVNTKRRRWSAWRIGAAICALLVALTAAGAAVTASNAAREDTPGGDGLDPRIAAVVAKPSYRNAHWGLLETDPATGRGILERSAGEFFIPGSTAKLFSVSGAWGTLGGDHRFTTPLHGVGHRSGGTFSGDLDLIARGDLTMGGRTRPDGTVAFTDVDHTYANNIPGATLTPQDPLAGLNDIARQVRRSGINRLDGDVVVDDRLFAPDAGLDPTPYPLIVNDNVIDLLTSPGAGPGDPAKLSWRPQVAPYRVTSRVRTVARGGPTDVQVTASPDGTDIRLTGTVAAGDAPVLRVSAVRDPAAFGRAALIEALERAGVDVTARPTGPNPTRRLPDSYEGYPRLAAYVSPPYAQYAKLIFKVSHNLGANLAICLMAVTTGSHACVDGFPVMAAFLKRAGVDTTQVQLLDGRGSNPVDRATPVAETQVLTYWLHSPEAARFRRALPVLGVDGSLAGSCRACPARGKIFGKTGTVGGLDALNNRLAVGAQTLAGYLDKGSGRFDVFYVGVNGASTPTTDIAGLLRIADDIALVGAYLQENAAARHS